MTPMTLSPCHPCNISIYLPPLPRHPQTSLPQELGRDFETALRQLWDNLGTTLGQQSKQVGEFDYKASCNMSIDTISPLKKY